MKKRIERLVFATNNSHKIEEVAAILGGSIELVTLAECGITDDIPENEPTIEGNSAAKAHYLYSRTLFDCFADDTGLEVEALGGEPGVRSARYAGSGHDSAANRAKLLAALDGVANRKARFRTVVTLIIEGEEFRFDGVVEGRIATVEQGEHGFGYDSIFVPDGHNLTFAQMDEATKNSISHRGRAVGKMSEFLTSAGLV